MFWRFGFHTGSAIDSLLDKEDVALEAILDEADLLQECKAQNNRLIDYFERVDVLQKLLGYVTGQVESEEKGRFKYPYLAKEVLCSDIWSIVETCVREQKQLLVPFWETVLDMSPDDMKNDVTMASHFTKVNACFMKKKPAEMLAFFQSQPNTVERLVQHIESPSFVDLIWQLIQLDEVVPNGQVLEWLSSQNITERFIDLLSPNHIPSVHAVVAELIKTILSSAPLSPAAALSGVIQNQNGPTSNLLSRELASRKCIEKLADYILRDFSEESCNTNPNEFHYERDGTLSSPTFESSISSVVQSMGIIIELIRKNNSDFFEPYFFHALRNRLMQSQPNVSHLPEPEMRISLEKDVNDLVQRIGIVHLAPVLDVMSSRLDEFEKYLKCPRSLRGTILNSIGTITPFTMERYRMVELYAELLHCSNMALVNRTKEDSYMYDEEGRLQGGLNGLEQLSKILEPEIGTHLTDDPMADLNEDEDEDEDDDERASTHAFPIRNPSNDSPAFVDSDEEMDDDMENGSDPSDEEAMEEIAMDDEHQLSPTPFHHSLPQITPAVALSPESSSTLLEPSFYANGIGQSPDSDSSSRFTRTSGHGSRKSSRSRRKAAFDENHAVYISAGEMLKSRFLKHNVMTTLVDAFFQFPWNNLLHSAVYDVVHQVLHLGEYEAGYNRELIITLFREARFLHRIVEGQARNEEESSKPGGIRLGYMGHLTLITQDVISALERFPPDLRLIAIQCAPEPEWGDYVTGRFDKAKKEDKLPLGGGKPVVKSSLARSEWKVDEDDFMKAAAAKGAPSGTGAAGGSSVGDDGGQSQNGSDGMKGEFRRARSVGPPNLTADFGPAPAVDDDDFDEDNISSGRAPHFARYLAQEMRSSDSDHFGSSLDYDDDDEGWLTQSNLGLTPSRVYSERRPLSSNAFGDSFDPSDAAALAMSHNPFNPNDDDGFGPFTNSTSSTDTFTFNSSFSDEESFESFGDFGDFQSADDSDSTPATLGSWTFASGSELGLDDDGFGGGPEGSSSR